ncbi:MAG: hypothetical protein AB7K04_07665 [Pseudorhodoplanes sp.]
MKAVASILGLICLIAAVMYWMMPAGSLPAFFPGYEAGSAHVHVKHGIAAAVVALILFGFAWYSGRRTV